MTVSELIAELQKYPPDFVVVLASDEEGNDFHKSYDLGYGYWNESYREYTSWTVDDEDEIERELTLDESNSVCIWP